MTKEEALESVLRPLIGGYALAEVPAVLENLARLGFDLVDTLSAPPQPPNEEEKNP